MTGNNCVLPLLLSLCALPVFAQSPSVSVDYRSLSGPINHPTLQAVKITYGGELTVSADEAQGDLPHQNYSANGHVRIHETDTTLTAAKVQFDGGRKVGVATDALFVRYPLTIRGKEMHLTPTQITASDGDFTTASPDVSPDYHIRVSSATLIPSQHQAVLRHATLYLFHTRLFTVPRIQFSLGGGEGAARRQAVFPVFGASTRYGFFATLGGALDTPIPVHYRLLLPVRQVPQIRLNSQQSLLSIHAEPRTAPVPVNTSSPNLLTAIRQFATLPPGPLPPHDPLLFHDFLPEPNPIRLFDAPSRGSLALTEEIANHVASYGNRRDDLYVSRLPEISLIGQVPLTRLPPPPTADNPQSFRAYLRHVVLYANGQATFGYYREQPDNVWQRRTRFQAGLTTLPLLVAPNTTLLPSVLMTTNSYNGQKPAYRFDQLSVALSHDFTDYSALGFQFLASNVSGASPFNFDVLDTSRELDMRLQLGSRRFAVAGRIRYDLSHSGIIDYQAAIAPGLRGFTPVFSYNFRTRSYGIGLEIPGITF